MKRNHRKGLDRKYFIFLVNLKQAIELNEYLSINALLKEHCISLRVNGALYDLGIVSRGRKKVWLETDPNLAMAQAVIIQVNETRNKKKLIPSDDKYYNTTHKEFQRLNPNAVRVGKGYYHPPKKERVWKQILSFRLFNLKCKFFKLK